MCLPSSTPELFGLRGMSTSHAFLATRYQLPPRRSLLPCNCRSRHVAALEHTLLAQRKLPRRRAGKAKAVPAQRKASRSQLKYHHGTRHKR